MERSIPYAVLDNIIGFRDDHETPGEKLGKALGEDPLGVATTVVKGVGKLAKSAFDRVVEEGPLDALTGSLSEYAESLIGSGKRLTSGTQGYINSGMTQAAARDAQISDALRLSEIFPLMSTAAYSARLGRAAIPDAPFDPSRRGFLGGIAALPAVAALAPDALTGVLKSVGPKVARAASSLDLSVAKINALIKEKDLLSRQADKLRAVEGPNGLPRSQLKSEAKVQDEIEQAARIALDDLNPADFANAADDSIETIVEQFSNSRVLESEMDNPAFDGLMKEVKLRGMNNAKDARGIDQFPYARDIYEEYYNPINSSDVKFPPSMLNPRGPQSLNMVRPVATDIKKGMTELNVLEINKRMQLREEKMIAEGNSASEIDAMKAELRQELYKVEGLPSDIGDFYADGGEVMNGIGSLNETARNMSRGPRGIGAYQQFADGGPVYMAEGGAQVLGNPSILPSNMKRNANGNIVPNNMRQAGDLRGIEMDRQLSEVGYSDMESYSAAANKFNEEYDARQGPDGLSNLDRGRMEDIERSMMMDREPLVMDREPLVMDREPLVMDREPLVMDREPREVMDPLVMDPAPLQPQPITSPAPLQPQPITSPAPSALNIGAGMSANDLQRMLARRSVGPTNLNEVNSSILSLQQAEVANRARRANVPPQRPYEPPPTGPSSPYGTPLTGPSSPYGPGSPYGPPPTGPGSPYGPPPTGPGSPYGPYGREVQPYGREVQPTSYGIGSFGQPMQQQGFGSNKPTANVLF